MKKQLILLAVCGLLCALPAFAAEENQSAQYDLSKSSEIVDVPVDESTYREEPPTPYVPVKRESGRGEIEDIYQYWEENGYPEDVSYAFESGGEVIDDAIYTYWEIGLVNADEVRKQEILDLISSTGLVTFYDCTYTHAQKMEAYEALLALNDENIRVIFVRNTDNVVAAVPEDQEKEYAQLLVGTYGAIVSVMGGDSIMEDLTQVMPGMGIDGAGAGRGDTGRWGMPDSEREASDALPLTTPVPALPEPVRRLQPLWLAGALAAGGGLLLLVQWTRNAAVRTAGGTAVTLQLSRRQMEEAIRNCEESPREGVYQSIQDRIEGQ